MQIRLVGLTAALAAAAATAGCGMTGTEPANRPNDPGESPSATERKTRSPSSAPRLSGCIDRRRTLPPDAPRLSSNSVVRSRS